MKVVLTGASSFTGFWFATVLARRGIHVVAPLRRPFGGYSDGARAARVSRLADIAEVVWDCPFGSDRFLDLVSEARPAVLCHHAAEVNNYRSLDFDVMGAVQTNTHRLRAVLDRAGTLAGVVLTGSVFEPDEGRGDGSRRAFSPYGLSKGLTGQVFRFWCEIMAVPLTKFVIPNPFGPYEEERFTAYLARSFLAGRAAEVRTPDYVRDNIHVSLLAERYAVVVAAVAQGAGPAGVNPSGYVERQDVFARRFAAEFSRRLGHDCVVEAKAQTDFAEPMARFNTEPAALDCPDWNENAAWEALVEYYREFQFRP
ncbi:hypothetical protein RHODGE_RHODGE_04126 [Rhodoplanes serenus]|uniref:NAD-dependent epimerase/dehydratase domain-containing protein n=1 Tax=Rhodoplanes serenus TaxID=200615 RepID=A0A3S4B400_9BRAD|nr:NAD-dependent epimerase/dehydratase family protein [Rhodoplanes serenus]VCU10922.1 hypothetical protein RHODGE_RHODGE_04126 [Rhodoplanes serenus]